jgi:hypothetical protein
MSLEEPDIPVRVLAYEEGWCFTRIKSRAVHVENMEEAEELKRAMDHPHIPSSIKQFIELTISVACIDIL